MKRTWKQYEQEICNIFKSHYPDAQISANVFREGRYSKANRQIDILIEGRVAGSIINIVIDGKYYNKKIDVKEVESFIGMLQD